MILITTPTRRTGAEILEQMVNRGEKIRVLARHPEKIPREIAGKIEIAQGSLLDSDELRNALDGCEAVYYCIPESHTHEGIPYYENFARIAAAAIKESGVKRIVYLSGGGKGTKLSAGIALGLHRAEDILAETGAAMRALRCPVFFESLLYQIEPITKMGMFFLPLLGEYKSPQVAARDISAAAAKWLSDKSWSDVRGVAVHGAEDISFNQIAEALSGLLDKPVRFQQISRERYIETLLSIGSSEAFASALTDMFEAIPNGLYEMEKRTPETTTPTTVQMWLRDVFAPRLKEQ